MGVSRFPPALSKDPPRREIFRGFRGIHDLHSREFASRVASFSIGRAVVFTCAVTLVIMVLTRTLDTFAFTYSVKVVIGVLGIAYVSAILQYWASRKRYKMYRVALGLVVLDQALFGAIAYVTGGVASGATSLLGIACLVGGLLLGVPGAVTAAIAGGIFFSLLVLMTQGGEGLVPPDQPAQLYKLSEGQAAYYYVFNLLMLLVVGLLASYLAERLQRAGGEVKEAQKRAEQAERMAALGQLAAGLAHEIRNPLGSISGAVQLLRAGAERSEDRDLCDIVLRESARLNELVSDMVDISRPRRAQKQRTDVGRIVRDVVELASQSGRGAGDVRVTRVAPESLFISADPDQVRQLVWNLVRNAIQASASGGQVRVRLISAPRAALVVEDEGMGIDSAAMAQLFDAFYTTRSKGAGIGLAVVKRIADEHEFSITVTSDPGDGTSFSVDFGPPLPDPAVA